MSFKQDSSFPLPVQSLRPSLPTTRAFELQPHRQDESQVLLHYLEILREPTPHPATAKPFALRAMLAGRSWCS